MFWKRFIPLKLLIGVNAVEISRWKWDVNNKNNKNKQQLNSPTKHICLEYLNKLVTYRDSVLKCTPYKFTNKTLENKLFCVSKLTCSV